MYLPDVEHHLIGLILHSPQVWSDLNLLAVKDFQQPRRPIYAVLKQQLDRVPQGSVEPVILVEKLKSYNVNDIDGVKMLDYLEGLQRRGRLIEPKRATELLKELKTATVRRELIEACDEAKRKVEKATGLDEMVGAVTGTLAGVNTEFFKAGQTQDMFAGAIEMIEERGNEEKVNMGYIGVLPSIDRTIGPLIHPGSFCNISARSGVGKSSFGFFYGVSTVELHPDMRLLWMDAGEMTLQQLQFRAAACFSKGRVPLWALRSGQWRKNKEWVDIVRGEVWPRVKNLIGRCEFKNVSGLTAKEKTQFIRRHYFNKVGRDHFLLVIDDYLKAMESLNKETKEYQAIGYYTSDVKNVVTDEIRGGFMTFTQSNRFGITKGKKSSEIQDNDSVISISDRIKDNCTTNFLKRFKVMDEMSREKGLFGNVVLKNLKTREGYGPDYEAFVRPLKVGNGFAEDYFNLDFHGFHYKDMGLYSDVLAKMGHVPVDMTTDGETKQMP